MIIDESFFVHTNEDGPSVYIYIYIYIIGKVVNYTSEGESRDFIIPVFSCLKDFLVLALALVLRDCI